MLCLVYGKFIEVWKQKEAVMKNSQLTRLLIANASHEGWSYLRFSIRGQVLTLFSPDASECDNKLS